MTPNEETKLYFDATPEAQAQADATTETIVQLSARYERINRAWWGPLFFFGAVKLDRRIKALAAYRLQLLWLDVAVRPERTTFTM